MTINPLKRLLCLFGRHRRSRGQAHDDGAHFVSVCRYCGIPMRRINRGWVVDRDEPPSPD